MRINHNINALNAWRNLGSANTSMGKSLEKLSSGLRINRAGDDAAGLAISEKMRSQIKGLDMATKNSQDAISLIQTAEGALTETHSMLQRMRELSVQAANDTNTAEDRAALQSEVEQLTEEIDRIAETTEFNTQKLLKGSFGLNLDQTASDIDSVALINNISIDSKNATDGSYKLDIMLINSSGAAVSALSGANADIQGYELTLRNTSSAVQQKLQFTTYSAVEGNYSKVQEFNFDEFGVSFNFTIESKTGTGAFTQLYAAKDLQVDLAGESGTFQIGANEDQNIKVALGDMSAENLGLKTGATYDVDVTTRSGANAAIATLDASIKQVSDERANMGAIQNRLEHTINNLSVASENLTAAESRIRDVDMAREMMKFTKDQILLQSSNAMLAQANQLPQNVLSLLR
jgi:flagellin